MTEQDASEPRHELLAAELALGLLEGEDLAGALRLRLADPEFGASVERWEGRLATFHDEWEEVQPSVAAWEAIRNSVPRQKSVIAIQRTLERWRLGAIAASLFAVVLMVVVFYQTNFRPPAPIDTALIAVAQIEAEGSARIVKARYDPRTNVMRLDVRGFDPGPLVPEVWVIPDGGSPVSLGQIALAGSSELPISPAQRSLVVDGVTMAVSLEPQSEFNSERPSSDPIAVGKLFFI